MHHRMLLPKSSASLVTTGHFQWNWPALAWPPWPKWQADISPSTITGTSSGGSTYTSFGSNAQRNLHDEAMSLMSRQHSHPLGPWELMTRTVEGHYNLRAACSTRHTSPSTASGIGTDRGGYQVLDLACGSNGNRARPLLIVYRCVTCFALPFLRICLFAAGTWLGICWFHPYL